MNHTFNVILLGVCLMDDDRLISKEDMKFGFEVWKVGLNRCLELALRDVPVPDI